MVKESCVQLSLFEPRWILGQLCRDASRAPESSESLVPSGECIQLGYTSRNGYYRELHEQRQAVPRWGIASGDESLTKYSKSHRVPTSWAEGGWISPRSMCGDAGHSYTLPGNPQVNRRGFKSFRVPDITGQHLPVSLSLLEEDIKSRGSIKGNS